jgi:hypothetical protein
MVIYGLNNRVGATDTNGGNSVVSAAIFAVVPVRFSLPLSWRSPSLTAKCDLRPLQNDVKPLQRAGVF